MTQYTIRQPATRKFPSIQLNMGTYRVAYVPVHTDITVFAAEKLPDGTLGPSVETHPFVRTELPWLAGITWHTDLGELKDLPDWLDKADVAAAQGWAFYMPPQAPSAAPSTPAEPATVPVDFSPTERVAVPAAAPRAALSTRQETVKAPNGFTKHRVE